MSYRVTDTSFYKYLKCPSWLAREGHLGDLRDALLVRVQQDGVSKVKELELLADRDVREVDLEDVDEAAVKTLALMKEGVQTIYKGVLVHGHYVAAPDVLERVEGRSNFGNYYYIACDIKKSRHVKTEYKFQGAFYAEVLAKVQGTKPQMGYVLHPDGTVDHYQLAEFVVNFQLTLDEIERILDGEHEPHFFTSGCKQSPFFSECQDAARKCDDLSLLNRVWRREVDALVGAGIKTVTDLANASLDRIGKVPDLTMDRLYFLQQQAIAFVEDRVIFLGDVDLPDEEKALVVDIETDPLHVSDYLFGVLVVDGEDEEYHAFFADGPGGERHAWEEFCTFLKPYTQQNMYHYGWYEVDVFRKLVERYGAPPEVQVMFEERMIDLLVAMREKVIFPTSFYSLKDIAKYLGFEWRLKDASGLDSILWYQEWLGTGDARVKQDILEYNEDDVVATWHVYKWLRENKA